MSYKMLHFAILALWQKHLWAQIVWDKQAGPKEVMKPDNLSPV